MLEKYIRIGISCLIILCCILISPLVRHDNPKPKKQNHHVESREVAADHESVAPLGLNDEVIKKKIIQMKIERYKRDDKKGLEGISLGQFILTSYTPYCKGCIGKTKTGYDVRKTIYYNGMRIISVDPNVIPLYSIVQIAFKDGSKVKAIALDTGSAIKNKKIDFLSKTYDDAIKIGVQKVQVRLLREGR